MNKTLVTWIIFLLSGAFLVGCNRAQEGTIPSSSLPGLYSRAFSPLDSSNVIKMSELKQIVPETPNSVLIASANYFPVKNSLLAVYLGDGYVRSWDLNSKKILFEQNLGVVSPINVGFDETGDLIIGATLKYDGEDDFGEITEKVAGVAIWDTNTGKLVYCDVSPCAAPSSNDWENYAISGFALDPKGHYIVDYNDLYVHVSSMISGGESYSFSEGAPGNLRHIAQIAFDPVSDHYAVAIKEGDIIVEEIGKEVTWFSPKIRLGTYKEQSRHKVPSLSFSPDGRLLARIQDSILSIWEMKTNKGELYSEFNAPNGHLLAFNPLSELLFVGVKDATRIIDLRKKRVITEYSTPSITSLSISSDNRLLVWGDQLGVIHVWGVR